MSDDDWRDTERWLDEWTRRVAEPDEPAPEPGRSGDHVRRPCPPTSRPAGDGARPQPEHGGRRQLAGRIRAAAAHPPTRRTAGRMCPSSGPALLVAGVAARQPAPPPTRAAARRRPRPRRHRHRRRRPTPGCGPPRCSRGRGARRPAAVRWASRSPSWRWRRAHCSLSATTAAGRRPSSSARRPGSTPARPSARGPRTRPLGAGDAVVAGDVVQAPTDGLRDDRPRGRAASSASTPGRA